MYHYHVKLCFVGFADDKISLIPYMKIWNADVFTDIMLQVNTQMFHKIMNFQSGFGTSNGSNPGGN